MIADLVLRDHNDGEICEHGYHLNHWVGSAQWVAVDDPNAEWCPGGREVTRSQIVRSIVAVFDANGLNDRSYYDDIIEGVDAALGEKT